MVRNAVAQWLRYYATSRKIAGTRIAELNGFHQFIYSFCPQYALEITQPLIEIITRERCTTIFLRIKARPKRNADNLTAICEPIA
jgi:hypothetical protein